jgi:phage terminase large subunit-like protein
MRRNSIDASRLNLILSLTNDELRAFLSRIDETSRAAILYADGAWTTIARQEQLPPTDDDWIAWLLLAGRGFGKTRTGAETVRSLVEGEKARRVALIGPTAADVRAVMVEGQSGLLSVHPPGDWPIYEPANRRILWENGAIATCYSADEPQRLRGPQHDFAWADELAAWRYPQEAWDMLMFGLRLGDRPRVVVTTTPRPIRLIRELAAAPTTRLTRGSTFANEKNLAASFLHSIVSKYEGTRLGRQELHAELLEQADGALWSRQAIEAARIAVEDQPELLRIVVAIDPAVTTGEHADETGIVVAGIGADGLAYVVRDASGRFSPNEWATRAINLYRLFGADRIVAETNNGGEMIELTLRTVLPSVAFKAVSAAKGKQARAEPVAALYEQGRVRHVGGFPALEDQMCNWEPGSGASSPDRVDALVWALTELVLEPRNTGALDFLRDRAERRKQGGGES